MEPMQLIPKPDHIFVLERFDRGVVVCRAFPESVLPLSLLSIPGMQLLVVRSEGAVPTFSLIARSGSEVASMIRPVVAMYGPPIICAESGVVNRCEVLTIRGEFTDLLEEALKQAINSSTQEAETFSFEV